MAPVRGTADVGLRRPDSRRATDRFPITWPGGIDPLQSVAESKGLPGKQTLDVKAIQAPKPSSVAAIDVSRAGTVSGMLYLLGAKTRAVLAPSSAQVYQ